MSTDPYFQDLFADRIGGSKYGKGTEIYKFEKIKRAKRAAIADFPNRPLLDFGIGENDEMAAPEVRAALKSEVDRPENRGYADNGILEYKEAVARFMQREFGVAVDPKTQVNHCIGSKTALAILPAAFINPGDITLMTVPGYPVAGTHTKYYGGEVHRLPLVEENGFLPDLDTIPEAILERSKLLVLNYPNSPTGALATPAFFEKVVAFARRHKLVVVNDAAHILLTLQGKPYSFLQTPGAMDVGVELHSMSKGFDMIGWRMGFVVGNELLVRAFADVKDNCDSGQFMAIQKAAAVALDTPSIPAFVREKYRRRMEKLVQALTAAGWQAKMPGGSYFLYVKAPKANGSTSFASAEDVSQFLIRERSICTVPWDDAGSFLRFSVTYRVEGEAEAAEAEEDRLMEELKSRLAQDSFSW
ncbi:MAG: LL-diaminopimelate aminotransferase [Bdellovibrionales bacterium]|nr:LL-diaminopimelate aminotransferase [Bdellovibrionales bacterium]